MISLKTVHQIRNERKYKYKKQLRKRILHSIHQRGDKFNQVNWLPYSRKEKWIASDPMSGE